MQNTPPPVPLRILLMLGVGVLLAHFVLLAQHSPPTMATSGPSSAQPVLQTRILPPAPVTVAATRPAAPARSQRSSPATPRPQARATASPVTDAAATGWASRDNHAGTASEAGATSDQETSGSDQARTATAQTEVIANARSTTPPNAGPNAVEPNRLVEPPVARPLRLTIPPPSKLTYDVAGSVRGLSYSAGAELLWKHDGASYESQLTVSVFLLGSRVQTSRGQITPEGLAPLRFSDKVRSEVAAHFDRDRGRVVFSANTPQASLQAGAQDHLSVFIQLASLFAADAGSYPTGSTLTMQAIGPRDASQWQFTVNGPARLQLPGGVQDTLKLTRAPAHTYDLTVELWLAPQLGYLPARIRLLQGNGDFVDLLWQAVTTP